MKRRSNSLAANVNEACEDVLQICDRYLSEYPPLLKVSQKLGIRLAYIPVVAAVILSMLFGVLDNIITNAVGFFYPAWQSFKAIESPDKHDDRQWLTYWVVYAFFTFVEIFGDFLLFWVPCYYLIKVAFLLWLFLPQFKGASIIYAQIIRPLLLQYEGSIDDTLNRMVGTTTQGAATILEEHNTRKIGLVAETSPKQFE